MKIELSDETIAEIARLAKIELSDEERARLVGARVRERLIEAFQLPKDIFENQPPYKPSCRYCNDTKYIERISIGRRGKSYSRKVRCKNC